MGWEQEKKIKLHKQTYHFLTLGVFFPLSSVHKFYSVFIHLQTSVSPSRVETSQALVTIHISDMPTTQGCIKPMMHTQRRLLL